LGDAGEALAADPGDARALYYRAVAHELLGEYGAAARDAGRGLALRPGDTALRDARAWAYDRMGRSREAMADARAALEIDPRDAYALGLLAEHREAPAPRRERRRSWLLVACALAGGLLMALGILRLQRSGIESAYRLGRPLGQ